MTDAAAWSAALDGLEEWVRRMASGLSSRGLDLPGEAPALPAGPAPAAVGLRLRALRAQIAAAETAGRGRRDHLVREQAYA